jgi:hypothetical protein
MVDLETGEEIGNEYFRIKHLIAMYEDQNTEEY